MKWKYVQEMSTMTVRLFEYLDFFCWTKFVIQFNDFLTVSRFAPFKIVEDEEEGEEEVDELFFHGDVKDLEFVPDITTSSNEDPYPTIAKKMKIVEFFRSGKKIKSLKTVQHSYCKVSDVRTIYRWEEQLRSGKIDCFFPFFQQFNFLLNYTFQADQERTNWSK